jgi:hypothetical protein
VPRHAGNDQLQRRQRPDGVFHLPRGVAGPSDGLAGAPDDQRGDDYPPDVGEPRCRLRDLPQYDRSGDGAQPVCSQLLLGQLHECIGPSAGVPLRRTRIGPARVGRNVAAPHDRWIGLPRDHRQGGSALLPGVPRDAASRIRRRYRRDDGVHHLSRDGGGAPDRLAGSPGDLHRLDHPPNVGEPRRRLRGLPQRDGAWSGTESGGPELLLVNPHQRRRADSAVPSGRPRRGSAPCRLGPVHAARAGRQGRTFRLRRVLLLPGVPRNRDDSSGELRGRDVGTLLLHVPYRERAAPGWSHVGKFHPPDAPNHEHGQRDGLRPVPPGNLCHDRVLQQQPVPYLNLGTTMKEPQKIPH